MPVPSVITDLSAVAASNSPAGSEAVLPNLDNYLRAHAAFIAQTYSLLRGCILPWRGQIADIPAGWHVCDGTNGTPDLRNRFIVGTGMGAHYAIGQTGGADSVALSTAQIPAHAHTGTTNADGSHSHTGQTSVDGGHQHGVGGSQPMGPEGSWSYRDAGSSASVLSGVAGSHLHSVTTFAAGSHAHTFTTATAGDGAAHENRPPFYALAFIAYVGA